MACCDHGVAAVICFHRGEATAARRHLAAAAPHAERIGDRVVGTLALARSEALEQEGALTEALDVLTGFADHAEELDEVEDLRWTASGWRQRRRHHRGGTLSDRAVALGRWHEDPSPPGKRTGYCRALVDATPARLLRAAERYETRSAVLSLGAKALEAAAEGVAARVTGILCRAAFSRAVDLLLVPRRDPGTWTGCRAKIPGGPHPARPTARAVAGPVAAGSSPTPAQAKIAALVAEGMTQTGRS